MSRPPARATLAPRAPMADRASSASWANSRLRRGMLHAPTVYKVNTQQYLVPRPMCVKAVRQIPMDQRRATSTQIVLAMLAPRAQMAVCAHSVSRASTKLRREMLRAPTAWQVDIQRRLVPLRMYVKAVPQALLDLRRATSKQTACARRALQAQTADHASSALRVSTKLRQEMLRAPTA